MPSNQCTILSQNDVVQHLPTDWIVCNELSNTYSEDIYTASVCTSVTPVTLALFAGSYKICSTLQNQRTGTSRWLPGSNEFEKSQCYIFNSSAAAKHQREIRRKR